MSKGCIEDQEPCLLGEGRREENLRSVEISKDSRGGSSELNSKEENVELEDLDKIEVISCRERENSLEDDPKCSGLHVGLRRKLTDSETKLLKRLKIDINPELQSRERRTIVLAELLILVSFTLRLILSAYLEDMDGQGGTSFTETVLRMIQGERALQGNSSAAMNNWDFKKIHIIGSAVTATFFLPHLFLLGLLPEKGLNLIVQLIVSLVTLGVGSYNQHIQFKISGYYEENDPEKLSCEARFTCNHASVSPVLYIIVIVFVVTTILRILFRTKYKFNIINIKCLGPYIEFFLSRRSRDFQSLTMLLFLTFTVVSGTVLNMKQRFRGVKSLALERETEVAVDGVCVVCTVTWLLLLFWIYCQVHHRYTHTMLVNKMVLEEELKMLGDRHKETLMDKNYSKLGYCPISKKSDYPVFSGHQYDGQVTENSSIVIHEQPK